MLMGYIVIINMSITSTFCPTSQIRTKHHITVSEDDSITEDTSYDIYDHVGIEHDGNFCVKPYCMPEISPIRQDF